MFEYLIDRAVYMYGADSDVVKAVRTANSYAEAYELVFPNFVVHIEEGFAF